MEKQNNSNLKSHTSNALVLDGFLNILWMDANTFISSPKRIVFRFYAESNLLTLHGWTNDNDTFPDLPDIKLNIGDPSGIRYGDKTYFGNLVLRKSERKAIKNQIGAFKYVVFLPHEPNTSPTPSVPPGQITYDIVLSDDEPTLISDDFASTPTHVNLNPSPPRKPK